MNFLMRTLGHCACLNLVAIGLTELGVTYSDTLYLLCLLLAGFPFSLYCFKSREIMRSGVVESSEIRWNRLKGMLKLFFFWVVLLAFPFFALYDEQRAFDYYLLKWGYHIDMGIFLQLVAVYVFFQGLWILRVHGRFPQQKRSGTDN